MFDLSINNVVAGPNNKNSPHPLHSSDTGSNFIIKDGLAHCWRHMVSLNALQYLVVDSGYMNCQDAGTGHSNSYAGSSQITGDNGAIFHAWIYAKEKGIIPINDPVPSKAMLYIAEKHNLKENPTYPLDVETFNKVIDIIQENY